MNLFARGNPDSRAGHTPASRVPPKPYSGDPLVRLETDAGPLWIPASDGVMRPYIQERGTWEADEGRLLLEFVRPGIRFADIGANVGYFSLLIAKHARNAVIHAFEPHPVTSRVLALNAWNSGADITPHALALSAGERTLTLSTAPTNLGDTRTGVLDTAEMIAPAAPLDSVLPDAAFDLVKIDVQGFEPDVLAGMTGALGRSPGVVIVSEFWPTALRERGLDPIDVLGIFKSMGLTIKTQVAANLTDLPPADIVRTCDQAGTNGQVNLVMTHARG
ncbi:FkbM family methyltransferase [Nocardioides sp. P5_C9_2]